MTTARIIQDDRKTTQSGKAKAGRWLLEFERVSPMRADPLTGWSGSGDTPTQIRLAFDSTRKTNAEKAVDNPIGRCEQLLRQIVRPCHAHAAQDF